MAPNLQCESFHLRLTQRLTTVRWVPGLLLVIHLDECGEGAGEVEYRGSTYCI